MTHARTGAARTAVAVLVLLLAPLLVAAESWHTCTLPAGIGAGTARVGGPSTARAADAHRCLACSLSRQSRLAPPGPAVPVTDVLVRALSLVPVDPPGSAPCRLAPPPRAPPA